MFCGKVETAVVPEGAPAEPGAPDADATVDVPELEITADGTPIFAPIVAVGVTPMTLFPRPVDPVMVAVPVGTLAPVDPASAVVPDVVDESPPAVAPTEVPDVVGVTVVMAGIEVAVAGVAVDVDAPATFPAAEEVYDSSSRQEASASATIIRLSALKVFTTGLLCRFKTAGEVVFQRPFAPA